MKFSPVLSAIGIAALSAMALAGCSDDASTSSSAGTSASATPTASIAGVCTTLGTDLGAAVKGLALVSGDSTGSHDYTCTWDDPKQSDPLKQRALIVQSAAATDPVDPSTLTGNAALAPIDDAHVKGLGGIVYAPSGSTTADNRIVSVDTPVTNTTITARNWGSAFDDTVAAAVVDAVVSE